MNFQCCCYCFGKKKEKDLEREQQSHLVKKTGESALSRCDVSVYNLGMGGTLVKFRLTEFLSTCLKIIGSTGGACKVLGLICKIGWHKKLQYFVWAKCMLRKKYINSLNLSQELLLKLWNTWLLETE